MMNACLFGLVTDGLCEALCDPDVVHSATADGRFSPACFSVCPISVSRDYCLEEVWSQCWLSGKMFFLCTGRPFVESDSLQTTMASTFHDQLLIHT